MLESALMVFKRIRSPVDRESLLVNELAEINNYIRSRFAIYMSWYTMTFTVNVVAIGWLIANHSNVVGTALNLARFVFVLIALWDLMGIVATLSIRSSIVSSDARIAAILSSISGREEHHTMYPRSPIPRKSLTLAFALAAISLFVLLLLWIVLARDPAPFFDQSQQKSRVPAGTSEAEPTQAGSGPALRR
jgi:hypothetical protein